MSPPPAGPVGILLAAGTARRFGRDKLLESLPDGLPVAGASARTLVASLDRVVAVVRPGADRLTEVLLACGAEVRACPDAAGGMGHSLACGVRASQDAPGWLVALADMPFVLPETVTAVARALLAGSGIARPLYRGQPGHPVGFAARFGPALVALHGDQGARVLLAAHRPEITEIPVEDPGCIHDLDQPADLHFRHDLRRG